jgi:hypothetical protein
VSIGTAPDLASKAGIVVYQSYLPAGLSGARRRSHSGGPGPDDYDLGFDRTRL